MSKYIYDGSYGTEKTFPEHIQKRIDAGMGCGSGIGKGWLPIVVELDKQLAELDPEYKIDQIKEKFGGLRFYVSSEPPNSSMRAIYDLINEAETNSYQTCEMCGAPGERCSPNRWILTLCENCNKEVSKE